MPSRKSNADLVAVAILILLLGRPLADLFPRRPAPHTIVLRDTQEIRDTVVSWALFRN